MAGLHRKGVAVGSVDLGSEQGAKVSFFWGGALGVRVLL